MNNLKQRCLLPLLILGSLALPALAASHPAVQGGAEKTTLASAAPATPAAEPAASIEPAISLNYASAEELQEALSGVGAKKAQAIVSYREAHGPFKSLEELRNVPGFGPALVERNLAHLKL